MHFEVMCPLSSPLTARYNDLDSVEQLFLSHPDQVACVIVEPVAANMGLVLPKPGFLQGLRQLCDKWNRFLILPVFY